MLGHIVSHNGIRPDDDKYKAIKEFPAPKNLKDLRSFLGLANQLAAFVPDLAHTSAGLLKKGNAWVWEKEHCLLYTSPSPRDQRGSRMPSSA